MVFGSVYNKKGLFGAYLIQLRVGGLLNIGIVMVFNRVLVFNGESLFLGHKTQSKLILE